MKTKHLGIFQQASYEFPIVGTTVLNSKYIPVIELASLYVHFKILDYSAHYKRAVVSKICDE